jgi:hypothetical protein
MNRILSKMVTWLSILLVTGCAVAPSEPVDPNALPGPRPGTSLTKGMGGDQVRELWGEPREVKPMETGNEVDKAEVWVYERQQIANMGQYESGTRDVPYVNPVTGESTMIPEPTYETKFDEVTVTTELLLFYGELIQWKQFQRAREQY